MSPLEALEAVRAAPWAQTRLDFAALVLLHAAATAVVTAVGWWAGYRLGRRERTYRRLASRIGPF